MSGTAAVNRLGKGAAASLIALGALFWAGGPSALADAPAPLPMALDTDMGWDAGLSGQGRAGSHAIAVAAAAAAAPVREPVPAPAFSSFATPLPPAAFVEARTPVVQLASLSALPSMMQARPVEAVAMPAFASTSYSLPERTMAVGLSSISTLPAMVPARAVEPVQAAVVAVPAPEPKGPPDTPDPMAMAHSDAPPPADIVDRNGRPTEEPVVPIEPTGTPPGEVESLRDAIVASLKSNPDIQIALAQQDDARFGIDQSRAAYMPHVDVTVGYGPEIAKQPTTARTRANRLEGSVTVSQNLWDWGVTINDIKRARASYRAAQWATREQIEGISFDMTNAYLGMLQQQKLIALANDEIVATKKILRMVTVQKELGLTTQADVDRAKARVDNIQSTLLDRQSALQQARDNYKRLTDRIPGIAVDLPPTAAALPNTVEEAVDMIDDHSPRMAQAVEDRRSLDRQYASQTGTFLPRVGVMMQANHKYDVMGRSGLSEDARAMVTVSYSFLNGGADVALRNRIGARLRQADYELDRRRREVEQDIRADFQSLGAARQKIATINSEIESAQRVADLYKQQFREGKRSVFDMLDSQQVLFAARGNSVGNEIAMHLAEYRVLQKLGGLFDLVSAGEAPPPLAMPAPKRK